MRMAAVRLNQPNPFNSKTKVGFYLNEGGLVQLSVYDLSGVRLQVINRPATEGYNEWIIGDLPSGLSSGLLYYKVETASETAIRKMVLIK